MLPIWHMRVIKMALVAVCCWSGATTARRQPRAQQQAQQSSGGVSGRGEAPVVAAARKLVANKQWEEAEDHTRLALGRLPAASGEDAAPLQLLHGQSLFELQRWGEAVVALQGATASATPAVSERAGRYLGVARQALTHSMFDLRAYSESQQRTDPAVPPCCARPARSRSLPEGDESVSRTMPAAAGPTVHRGRRLPPHPHTTSPAAAAVRPHRRGRRLRRA